VEDTLPNNHAPTILGLVQSDGTHSWWNVGDLLDAIALVFLKARDPNTPNMEHQEFDALLPIIRAAYEKFPNFKRVPKDIKSSFRKRVYSFRPITNPELGPESETFGRGVIGQNTTMSKGEEKIKKDKYKEENKEKIDTNLANIAARRAAAKKRGPTDPDYVARLDQQKVVREKRQTKAKIERVETQVDCGGSALFMTPDQLEAEKKIVLDLPRDELRGMSLRQLIAYDKRSMYIGITARDRVDREGFTVLGRKYATTKNRDGSRVYHVGIPGVTLPDGRRIKGKTEAKEFGFFVIKVWSNQAMFNCERMEEMLQNDCKHLPYGEKLWRDEGKGEDYVDVFSQHCCVYLLVSFDVHKYIDGGKLIWGDWNKTVDWDKKNKVGIYAERNDENVENGP